MRRRRQATGALLVAPATLLVGLLFILPTGMMLWLSLQDWPLLGTGSFVGLTNYRRLAGDETFLRSLVFTAGYVALVAPLTIVVGYLLAILVRRRIRGVALFRTGYFMPFAIGFASASFMLLLMMQPDVGLLARGLHLLGVADEDGGWLQQPMHATVILAVAMVWKTAGLTMVLFLGGMQSIPGDIYEAAAIDGAGWWSRELRITLPMLRRTLALALVVTITSAALAFDQFYIVTQGGPGNATLTTVMWIYRTGFAHFELGYASAMSVALLAVIVVLNLFQLRWLREDLDL
jgi:multiple sugar transport system permease protein